MKTKKVNVPDSEIFHDRVKGMNKQKQVQSQIWVFWEEARKEVSWWGQGSQGHAKDDYDYDYELTMTEMESQQCVLIKEEP